MREGRVSSSAATAVEGSATRIEAATWRDISAVRHIGSVCFPKDAWPLLDIIGVLTMPNIIRLKAVQDGQAVGFIACDLKREEGLAWIATVGVLPEYRRQGNGTRLLQMAEASVGLKTMRLNVRASNYPALKLYGELGYSRVGEWRRYYQDGEDALVLEKRLD